MFLARLIKDKGIVTFFESSRIEKNYGRYGENIRMFLKIGLVSFGKL